MAVSLFDVLVSGNPGASPLAGMGKVAGGALLLAGVAIMASLGWRRRGATLRSV